MIKARARTSDSNTIGMDQMTEEKLSEPRFLKMS